MTEDDNKKHIGYYLKKIALLETEIADLRKTALPFDRETFLIITDEVPMMEVGLWIGRTCKEDIKLLGFINVQMANALYGTVAAQSAYGMNQTQSKCLWQAYNASDAVAFKLRWA